MILGLLLVLGAFGLILRSLSHAAYRETDVVAEHMRAVSVGEAGFAEIVARLSARPWSERWFAGGPDVASGRSAADGSYAYVIQDTPADAPPPDPAMSGGTGKPNQADLLIQATYEHSTALMFWRLTVPEDSIESLARVVPVIYTFAPGDTPVTPPGIRTLGGRIDDLLRQRTANRQTTDPLSRPLGQQTTLPRVQSGIGLLPNDPGLDEPPYVEKVNKGEGSRPPAGPPPSSGFVPPTVAPPPPPVVPATGSNRIFICHVRDLIRYLPWCASQIAATDPALAAQMNAAAAALRTAFYGPPGPPFYDPPGGPGIGNAEQVAAYYNGLALFQHSNIPNLPKFPTWSPSNDLSPWRGP